MTMTRRTGRVPLEPKKLTPESVRSLYEQHGAALAAYACCCGLDFASAEDVVHQVFLKLLRGGVIPEEAQLAYLYRAVRNTMLNQRRDRRREAEFPETEFCFTHPTSNQAEVLSLQNALRELPNEQRETVFLKIWSGMTLQEIAQATETPLNTVASRYRYALDKLRQHFREKPGKAGASNAQR
jgi:RNA polymerase sigma-70 factor, ECF subfamily